MVICVHLSTAAKKKKLSILVYDFSPFGIGLPTGEALPGTGHPRDRQAWLAPVFLTDSTEYAFRRNDANILRGCYSKKNCPIENTFFFQVSLSSDWSQLIYLNTFVIEFTRFNPKLNTRRK